MAGALYFEVSISAFPTSEYVSAEQYAHLGGGSAAPGGIEPIYPLRTSFVFSVQRWSSFGYSNLHLLTTQVRNP